MTLHFYPSTTPAVHVRLGNTAEDLNCDLGPPLRVYYKEDDRMTIHASSPSSDEGKEMDCKFSNVISNKGIFQIFDADFYNYFQLGLDFLISGSTHKVKKIILHSNVVRSV